METIHHSQLKRCPIGEAFATMRVRNNITLKQVADNLERPVMYVWRFENSTNGISAWQRLDGIGPYRRFWFRRMCEAAGTDINGVMRYVIVG